MYFSNVSNDELQYFHKKLGTDFSMSLTDILSSDLFYTETIITDEIYRIYPLFYCEKITSSNNSDKILDNCCIILSKQSDSETYLTFQTNSTENIIIDDSLLTLFDIGDSLTVNQYNDFIYRLRKQTVTGTINYKEENIITGLYGKYTFNNLNEQLRTSKGLIVNDRLRNNPVTVKLTDPFFLDANYVLTFTVYGANSTTSFNIQLVEDVEIALPVSSYTNDDVVSFDVSVNVNFNKYEIRTTSFSFDMEMSKVLVDVGESVTLTATLTNDDEVDVEGYAVSIFEDGSLIDSINTDSDGQVTKTITPSTTGLHTYSAKCLGFTKEIIVTVNANPTELVSTISNTSIGYGGSVTATATLTSEETAIEDADIRVYVDNNLMTTLQTNSVGVVSYTASNLNIGSHIIRFDFEQTNEYNGATSSKSVTVNKLDTTLGVSSSGSTVYGGTVTFTGALKQGSSNLSDKTVYVYLDNNLVKTATTNNGSVSYSVSGLSIGSHTVRMVFNGDTIYNASEGSRSVSIASISSSISISANPSSTTYGSATTLSGTLSVGSGQTVRIYQNNSYIGSVTTGSGGSYSYTTGGLGTGTHSFFAYYGGNGTYSSCTSSNVNVNVGKMTSTMSLSASSTNINVNDTVTIQGNTNIGGGQSIKIYENNVLIDTVTTETNGSFSKTMTLSSIGNHTFKAVYDGNSLYTGVESSAVTVGVTKKVTSLTLVADNTSINYGDNVVLTGSYNIGAGKTLKLYRSFTSNPMVVSTGSVTSFNVNINNLPIGDTTFYLEFEGDDEYTSATTQTITITVKYGTNITVNVDARSGEGVYLNGVLSGVGSATAIKVYAIETDGTKHLQNVTTDDNGAYTSVWYYQHNRLYFKVVYEGDSTHYSASYTTAYYSW